MTDSNPDTGETDSSSDHWVEDLNPRRLTSLCDGIFAVAMTILVFQLSIPQFTGNVTSLDQITSFGEMTGEFYIYVLSFLVLGIYWIMHHYMFHHIKRSNGILIWINIAIMIMVTLVPFSAAVMRANSTLVPGERAESNVPYSFFMGTTILTILMLLGMWQYSTRGYRLVDPGIDRRVISALTRTILIGCGVTFVGFVLSFYVPIASILGFFAMFFTIAMTAYAKHGLIS